MNAAAIVADDRRRHRRRAARPACRRRRARATPLVIAADGGLDHARAAGLDPDVLVGDLDSISALGLAWASEHAEVVRHPVDKAATDTELAIAHAATFAPGAHPARRRPGRSPRPRHRRARRARRAGARRRGLARGVVGQRPVARRPRPARRRPRRARRARRSPCSPCTARPRGVTVGGARWPLTDHTLEPLVGLGVSNVVETAVTVDRHRRHRHRRRPRSRLVKHRPILAVALAASLALVACGDDDDARRPPSRRPPARRAPRPTGRRAAPARRSRSSRTTRGATPSTT